MIIMKNILEKNRIRLVAAGRKLNTMTFLILTFTHFILVLNLSLIGGGEGLILSSFLKNYFAAKTRHF